MADAPNESRIDSGSLEPGSDASKDDQKLLELARKRFHLAAEAEADFRRLALEDLQFSVGDQWDPEVKNQRQLERRPTFTINRLPQFIRQITNDQRQNRPSTKVSPVDDAATVDTAKILQGMVRHIENDSNADAAHDTSFEFSVRSGRGFFRILTDYCDPMSFDQDLKVKRIANSLTVYFDPASREPDGSDANFAFVIEDTEPEEFEELYPNAEKVSAEELQSIGDQAPDWMDGRKIRVAEYFYKDFSTVRLVQLSDGSVANKAHLPEKLPNGLTIKQERDARVPTVKWAKICGNQVLEKKETVFDLWLPVIPVYGEDIDINGKRHLAGIVRNSKDAQKLFNIWKSTQAETIALAPRAPWVGAEGQFEGHEEAWRTANVRNHPFLQYKAKDLNGQPLPPPARQTFEPAIQAVTEAANGSIDDLKGTTGIYDSELGNRSNEQSGVAIQRRNAQSQTSNFHYIDNLTRSLKQAGRVLIRAIPKVYDTPRAVRILHPDSTEEVVKINQEFNHNGKVVTYDLDRGKYDVVMETGPSYATKRQEAVASMIELSRNLPVLNTAAPDLLVKAMDWEGASDIAERLRKTLPPALQDDAKGKQPVPAQVQAQLSQLSQMNQQLIQAVHGLSEKLETKSLEIQSRERINLQNNQTQAAIALAKIGSERDRELLRVEEARIQSQLDRSHEAALMDADQDHQRDMAEQTNSGMAGPDGSAPPAPTGGPSPGNSVENP